MSRAHSDRLHLDLCPCDLLDVVRETIDDCRLLEPSRAIEFSTTYPGPITVCADAQRIAQVIVNYLSNALRYAPPDRPIVAGVRVDGTWACVWVRDEGPGIAVADQERIWDQFYRAMFSGQQVRSTEGLGVGLFISKTIIERHGGQVGVESAMGAGATFWFTLPLLTAGHTTCQ
jgi:signal transduction histidine kinase